jgi:hypothetical protein
LQHSMEQANTYRRAHRTFFMELLESRETVVLFPAGRAHFRTFSR